MTSSSAAALLFCACSSRSRASGSMSTIPSMTLSGGGASHQVVAILDKPIVRGEDGGTPSSNCALCVHPVAPGTLSFCACLTAASLSELVPVSMATSTHDLLPSSCVFLFCLGAGSDKLFPVIIPQA